MCCMNGNGVSRVVNRQILNQTIVLADTQLIGVISLKFSRYYALILLVYKLDIELQVEKFSKQSLTEYTRKAKVVKINDRISEETIGKF